MEKCRRVGVGLTPGHQGRRWAWRSVVTRGTERVSLESDCPKSFHSKPFLVPDAVSDVLGSPGWGGGFSEREVHDEWALGSWSRTRPPKQTRL